MKRSYESWLETGFSSEQREYTAPTELLAPDGSLQAAGWARHNVFDYDRSRVRHALRRKEWDFYQISDGSFMVQISFANISLGGYASAVLVDLKNHKTICFKMAPFMGGKDKYVLPAKGDVPSKVRMEVGKSLFETVTEPERRSLRFELGELSAEFTMDILAALPFSSVGLSNMLDRKDT